MALRSILRHALLKAQAIHAGAAELIVQPGCHAVEFQAAQLFQGGVHHHGVVLSVDGGS